MAITARDRAILDFEQGWWLVDRPKEGRIRAVLGLSPTAFYRRLNEIIDDPEAIDYDPLLVRRLRRTREERRRQRFDSRPAGERPIP